MKAFIEFLKDSCIVASIIIIFHMLGSNQKQDTALWVSQVELNKAVVKAIKEQQNDWQ